MNDYEVTDTETGQQFYFDTKAEAEEKIDEMQGLRKMELTDEPEEPDEPEEQTDGGEVIISDASGEPQEEFVEETDLPDRTLTEDPIDWLRNGSNDFTANIKGTTVITKKGFRVLQHFYDISTGSDVLVGPEENGDTFCRVKAWAEMPDGRRAEAHASAHVDRGDDHFLLVSMADTRAKSRALSDVTGCGAVAAEEMDGVKE